MESLEEAKRQSNEMNWALLLVGVSFFMINGSEAIFRNLFGNNSPHIAAVVLARGGSKTIPLKNLAKVGGKTLLKRSLEVLEKTKSFSSIWVSTDHELIAQEAQECNADVHWRSEDTATDTASSIFAVQEFLKHHSEVDYVALIQCTSVFLKPEYLQKALSFLKQGNVDCVFSVTRSFKLRWAQVGSYMQPLNFNPKKRPRRQDWRGELIENGMFYISRRDLIENGYFQNNRCKVVEVSDEESLEIDTHWDLHVANAVEL